MRISRLECEGLVAPRDLCWDIPPEGVVVTGANGEGKTSVMRLLSILLGQASQSLGTLLREGEDACWATLWVEHDGERYRLHRRSTAAADKIETEKEVGGSWVAVPPSAVEALKRLFAPKCGPERLLKPQSDAELISLLLGVVPNEPYDPAALLAELGVTVRLDPMPTGLHVLDWMERVEDQLVEHRRAAGKARASAESVCERELRGLPAEPVPPGDEQLARARSEAEGLRAKLAGLKQRVETARLDACRAADQAYEAAVQQAEIARRAARAEAQRLAEIALGEAPDLERAIGAAEQQAKDAQAAHDRHIADVTRREGLAAARLDAEAQGQRYSQLDALIRKVRAKAADFIGAALPGVRIGVDERGVRYPEVECPEGWVEWSKVNKAKRMSVGAAWAQLRQQRGAGTVIEAVVLMDEAEALTSTTLGALVAKGGQIICTRPADGPLRLEKL